MSDDTFNPPHALGLRGADPADPRDFHLRAPTVNVDQLPDRVDLSSLLPPVMDQRNVSACVGYAVAETAYTVLRKDGHKRPYVPSPVFIYREARAIDDASEPGSLAHDWGTYIRSGFKVINKLGMPSISDLRPRFMAADIANPTTEEFSVRSIWRRQPAAFVYREGEQRQMLEYYRLPGLADLLGCLADGWCAAMGINVMRSFYGSNGQPLKDIPDPVPGDRLLGGHAITVYGYDKKAQRLLIFNHWGPTAHQGGPSFTISFNYYTQHASDVWTARRAEGGKATS